MNQVSDNEVLGPMTATTSVETGTLVPRERILDAAEELFALNGYFGVTMRDITRKAHVDLALPNYHFGSKEELLRHVIARRAEQHCHDIVAALDEAYREAAGRPPTVERILEALVSPVIDKLTHGGTGWRNYITLIAHLRSIPQNQHFLSAAQETYLPVERRYVEALRDALPSHPPELIYWAFYFTDASIIHVLSNTRTIDLLSEGMCRSDDFDRIRTVIVPFLAAGFYRLASCSPPNPLSPRH